MDTPWHYFYDRIVEGPISQTDLSELFRAGRVPLDVLVWNKTLNAWTVAKEVKCFRRIVPNPTSVGNQTNVTPLSTGGTVPLQPYSVRKSAPLPPPPPPISQHIPAPPPPASGMHPLNAAAKRRRWLPILLGTLMAAVALGLVYEWLAPPLFRFGAGTPLPPSALVPSLPLPGPVPDAPPAGPQPPAAPPPNADESAVSRQPLPAVTSYSGDILNAPNIEEFIRSYYEGVENKDLARVMDNYDAVVSCGPQGLRTRTAIRADMQSYFAQYRSLVLSIESIHVDIDAPKAVAHVSFVIRYRKIPESGVLDAGHGTERWSIIVRDKKLAISSIEEAFFSGQ